jgi:cysteine desulfurase / selenocysteine lyase
MIDRLIADRATEFPITRTRTFLAHAAFCPLPARVAAAVADAATQLSLHGQASFVEDAIENGSRASAGRMLGCAPADVAYVANTSTGMSLVSSGFRLRPGDNIVLSAGDFPAVSNPWTYAAKQQGATVRTVDAWAGELLDAVDDDTRAVVVSTVHYATGRLLPDLRSTARILRERGILVVIDAIQTLGTMPFDVEHLDVVVADGHKWLLAPKGAAIMYVSQSAAARIEPPILGWRNMTAERQYAPGLDFADGARRFEAGSLNILGMAGMDAAVSMFNEIGQAAVWARLRSLIADITDVLGEYGLEIPPPETPLICVPMAVDDARSLIAVLESDQISVSLRHDADGSALVRIAPHFYNNDDDVARLAKAIATWRH